MKKRLNNKGFTLVELIVVIAVLAIITVVVAPQFIKYVEKARVGTDENTIGEVAHAAEVAFADMASKEAAEMQIRIDPNGVASYQAPNSPLVGEVKDVIAENSYLYKSETYRGKTVKITVDEDGNATWLPARANWTPSNNETVNEILSGLKGGDLTAEEKDKFDKALSDWFTSVDEFTGLGKSGMTQAIEQILKDLSGGWPW